MVDKCFLPIISKYKFTPKMFQKNTDINRDKTYDCIAKMASLLTVDLNPEWIEKTDLVNPKGLYFEGAVKPSVRYQSHSGNKNLVWCGGEKEWKSPLASLEKGKPSNLMEDSNPDWAPSQHLGYGGDDRGALKRTQRYERTKQRSRKVITTTASGGTPPPSQMTDELQRVGDIASHMAVRLPNPCDSDRSRHNAVPGGSQPSKSQCTPAVAALLSETQDRPLEQFAGMA
ncbi:hypothetical protein HPB49_013077 [Dermacentor silvarum]|uniref:Uncharacterized protein n=1 Tax=Dermacentor silvarum TaxID=543639 RepID=A0ACB8DDB7_DERSI|nr:hypothetical protein HPB49_013077 [Dermacentor silvarum]